jgi:hypothetical protein
MEPLKNELPHSDDNFFVLYDIETTQDTKFSGKSNVHILILVCLQQFCTTCEMQDDIDVDCERCGMRRHSFFEDPVGDLLSYLCEPRSWCKKVMAIAHNARLLIRSLFCIEPSFLNRIPKLFYMGKGLSA